MLSDGQHPSFNNSTLTLTEGVSDLNLYFKPRYICTGFKK